MLLVLGGLLWSLYVFCPHYPLFIDVVKSHSSFLPKYVLALAALCLYNTRDEVLDDRRHMDQVAERIAELRERRALTLRELSEMSGVAADTINQIELGHRRPRPSTLRKLARAFEVSVEEFYAEPVLPKASAPTPGLSVEEAKQGPLAARLLRAWRAYVWDLVLRWEKEGNQPTAAQIQDVLDALQRLVDSGAFERPADTLSTKDTRELADWFEVSMLFKGIDRLRTIAERAVANEEAARARRTFEVIEGFRERAGA